MRFVKLLDLNEKSKIYDSKFIVFSQKSWKDVLVYQNKWINHDPLQWDILFIHYINLRETVPAETYKTVLINFFKTYKTML